MSGEQFFSFDAPPFCGVDHGPQYSLSDGVNGDDDVYSNGPQKSLPQISDWWAKHWVDVVISRVARLTCASALLITSNVAWAAQPQDPLSPVALFVRCYSHLTKSFPPSSHPLRQSVALGQISPTEACLQVLDKAKLAPSGSSSEGQLILDTSESRQVLKTLNDFHRTWFPNDSYFLSLPGGDDGLAFTRLVQDEEEGALHVSRTLFTNGVPFSEVVTGDSGMEALRTSGPRQNSTLWTRLSSDQIPIVGLVMELVQKGALLGMRKLKLNPAKAGKVAYTNDTYNSGSGDVLISPALPVNDSLGGGVIGTKSYMLLNLGRPDERPMNGGVRMPRRWSRAVMSNLMCRDVPVIRLADSISYVTPTNQQTNLTPPFRRNASCMQCHASMDGMAAVARNHSYAWAPLFGANATVMGAAYLAPWPVTLPSETGLVDDDKDFHKRPPNGEFLFRSYDGTLINQQLIGGVSSLGQAIAGTNDFYACAAARYFEYFTGIRVSLQDVGDTSLPALSPTDVIYRNLVIQLGQDLKRTQSLRTLISEIISSPIYRRNSMIDGGP